MEDLLKVRIYLLSHGTNLDSISDSQKRRIQESVMPYYKKKYLSDAHGGYKHETIINELYDVNFGKVYDSFKSGTVEG